MEVDTTDHMEATVRCLKDKAKAVDPRQACRVIKAVDPRLVGTMMIPTEATEAIETVADDDRDRRRVETSEDRALAAVSTDKARTEALDANKEPEVLRPLAVSESSHRPCDERQAENALTAMCHASTAMPVCNEAAVEVDCSEIKTGRNEDPSLLARTSEKSTKRSMVQRGHNLGRIY